MANYNFTVRATDSAGAYADQNFSINVQRTRIDRFLVHIQSPFAMIARSPDGLNWTIESSPFASGFYESIIWSNGMWIATPYNFAPPVMPVYTSTDAINWKSQLLNLPKGIYTAGTIYPQMIKFRGGRWVCYAPATRTDGTNDIVEYYSDDFVTWTQNSVVVSGMLGGQSPRVCDFDFDSSTNTTVLYLYTTQAVVRGSYIRVGSTGTWSLNPIGQASGNYGQITFQNGIWFASFIGSQLVFFSRNGVDWTSRTFPQAVTGVTYSNGRICVTTTGGRISSSSDLITWSEGVSGISTVNRPRGMASYGGKVVAIGSNTITTTTNYGATTTVYTLPNTMSSPISISTRT